MVLFRFTIAPSSRFFPRDLGRFRVGSLAPPVEGRKVSSVPGFAESRPAQILVGTDLPRHAAQVVPQVSNRRASPNQ